MFFKKHKNITDKKELSCLNCKSECDKSELVGLFKNRCPVCNSKNLSSYEIIENNMEHDFDKIIDDFKDDPTIKSINAGHQPDGTPYLRIERFKDCNPVAKLNAIAAVLKGCESMDFGEEQKHLLADVAAALAKQITIIKANND